MSAPCYLRPLASPRALFLTDGLVAASAARYGSYGAMLAAKSVDPAASPWPGTWAPKQVLAGWQGTNLAAYETDFYHNIVSVTPELRQVFGAGEEFLGGIDKACASHNMTAQLCAGNPPSLLSALTMPRITQARASIDYDWDGSPPKNGGPRSNNGAHNWAALDNSWVFWATRIAPSKGETNGMVTG